MNEKLNIIFNRRSVRKFTPEKIDHQLIIDILHAAMAAPSANATDPWRFVVVENPDQLAKMADIFPYGKMLKSAAAAIIVCGDITKANRQMESYLLQDCSASVENILIAARALNIGSCWIGTHPNEDRMNGIREFLELPKEIIPVATIALGRAVEWPQARTRYQESFVHFEKW